METMKKVESAADTIWRLALRIALWGLVGYFLFRVKSIVITVLLAAILTYAVMPLVDFALRYRINAISRRTQRVILTIVAFVILICLLIILVTGILEPLQSEFYQMQANYSTYVEQLSQMASTVFDWYTTLHPDLQKFIKDLDYQGIAQWVGGKLQLWVGGTSDLVRYLLDLILIPVLAFYFALDSKSLKREFIALLPSLRMKEALRITHEVNSIMRSYVIGQIILCLIAGVVVGIILYFAGVPYVLLLSVFAAVTRAIPVIGPVISGIVIVLLGTTKSPLTGFNLFVLFAALHFIESKFVMPKLIGKRMQLHPAVIIIVLLIGAEFFGIFGMFIAAPVAAVLRVLIRCYLVDPSRLAKEKTKPKKRLKRKGNIEST